MRLKSFPNQKGKVLCKVGDSLREWKNYCFLYRGGKKSLRILSAISRRINTNNNSIPEGNLNKQ